MEPRKETLRDAHSAVTRERILDAAFALIERGVEPTMRAVAREAAIGERTVYRYFDSHGALALALAPRFRSRAGAALPPTLDGIEGYVRELFETFERNANLITSIDTAPWMIPHFERTRRRNLDALQALVDAAFPDVPAPDRAAAAGALRVVISGAGWRYLRQSCGLSNEVVIEQAIWLWRTVRERLRAGARRPRKR